ncbi:DUF2798 domain-containing protein [Rheinheimera sp. MM224]|uniref:DUF2798 domain-containing protein n=1 Tax=Rheinheimera sp. MM224 TaxID=3019969 RepID=UPI0021F88F79|nr:DUF2798 domain-containing protein [Rheinheimera sp. MM224]CAI3804093.1 hypothetical protein JAMGFMIE_03532 [Rheinheimera sp. MM224]
MIMIPSRFSPYVFSFFMSLLMSGVMSFCITTLNLGWVNNLLLLWLQAWSAAFVIAFPTIVLVTPLVRKLVTLVISTPKQNGLV